MVDFKAGSGKIIVILEYSVAGILGIIVANYIGTAFALSGLYSGILGAVIFAVPCIWSQAGVGPVKLFLGVTGLTMVLRAVLGYANIALPSQVSPVI